MIGASVQNLSEIPKSCVYLVRVLDEQPLFNGNGCRGKKCKVISLEDGIEVEITKIINENARSILRNAKHWQIAIHGSGDSPYQFSDSSLRPIKHGLVLWVFDDIKNCSIDELSAAYEKVLDKLRNGWAREDREIPKIVLSGALQDSHLFTKKADLTREDVLIKLLIAKLGMVKRVKCDEYKGTIYLWIKKSELPEFVARFFRIPTPTPAGSQDVKTDGPDSQGVLVTKAPEGAVDNNLDEELLIYCQLTNVVKALKSEGRVTTPTDKERRIAAEVKLHKEIRQCIDNKDFTRALELAEGLMDEDDEDGLRDHMIACLKEMQNKE